MPSTRRTWTFPQYAQFVCYDRSGLSTEFQVSCNIQFMYFYLHICILFIIYVLFPHTSLALRSLHLRTYAPGTFVQLRCYCCDVLLQQPAQTPFVKPLNEDCVQMFFILVTWRLMLIPNYFVKHQMIDTVCTHSSQKQKTPNCCPPPEVADTVTHCHILNFHYTKTPL